jgi:nitrate reductase gamma subunit
MDLLDFARGPALAFALAVFVLATSWRLIGIFRLPRMPDLSTPREGAPSNAVAALRAIVALMGPRKVVAGRRQSATVVGYVFHIGLALVFFGYAPHIAFVRRLTGLTWPALPDAVMVFAAGLTIVTLLIALAIRLSDPVLQTISTRDDWITWSVTFLPLVTGMAVIAEPSASLVAQTHTTYRGPLAVHLLSFELLLVWFPFGKLMHAVLFVFSRGATGIRFGHRGVKV